MTTAAKPSKVLNALESDAYSVKHLVTLMNGKGYKRGDAREMIHSLFDIMSDCLKNQKCVRVQGFGTFKPSIRASKEMINPLNKEKIITKPRLAVRLKLAKELAHAPRK